MFGLDLIPQLWILAIVLAIHEAEEWNIYGWYQRNYVEMPPERTPTTIRFFLVFLSVVGFVWVGAAVAWGNPSAAAWIIMPLVGLIVQNVLQHLYWQARFKEYAPGIWSAVLLLLPVSIAIVVTSLRESLVSVWYVLVLGAAIIPGLVDTVKSGNRLSSGILAIHRFSIRCVAMVNKTC